MLKEPKMDSKKEVIISYLTLIYLRWGKHKWENLEEGHEGSSDVGVSGSVWTSFLRAVLPIKKETAQLTNTPLGVVGKWSASTKTGKGTRFPMWRSGSLLSLLLLPRAWDGLNTNNENDQDAPSTGEWHLFGRSLWKTHIVMPMNPSGFAIVTPMNPSGFALGCLPHVSVHLLRQVNDTGTKDPVFGARNPGHGLWLYRKISALLHISKHWFLPHRYLSHALPLLSWTPSSRVRFWKVNPVSSLPT